MGIHLPAIDITDKIKSVVQAQVNTLVTTFQFKLGPTFYNVTGLINTMIGANLKPGEDLDCPTTLGHIKPKVESIFDKLFSSAGSVVGPLANGFVGGGSDEAKAVRRERMMKELTVEGEEEEG